jgi:hypothetical protein
MFLRVVKGIFSAAMDFGFAGAFLITWIDPYRLGPQQVRYFMYLMLLEFLVVHSSGFLGVVGMADKSRVKKILTYFGFIAIYSLFAGAFSLAAESTWPLIAFWGLTLAKFPVIVIADKSDARRAGLILRWTVMGIAYVTCAGITTAIPLPALGVTDAVIAAQEFTAEGLWIEEPYRVLAFGTLYFSLIGLFEIWMQLVEPDLGNALTSFDEDDETDEQDQ